MNEPPVSEAIVAYLGVNGKQEIFADITLLMSQSG
jgi:hypothetical protein